MIIPPLNTDVQFSKELIPRKRAPPPFLVTRGVRDPKNHPQSFSWAGRAEEEEEEEEIGKKKALISPVLDQQACGSCWAFAVATTMSDCLVVSGAVNWAPSISPTFCMACYPQGRCNGGYPVKLAHNLEKYGSADQTCLDYSWCENSSVCNIGDSSQHFKVDSEALSNMIPNKGCMFSNDKYVYFLDKGTNTLSVTDSITVSDFRDLMKRHIIEFGPAIGGYLVLNNFLDGKFTQGNGGIYFDRADYANIRGDGTIPFSDSVKSSSNCAGFHAVSIVGWGVEKNVQFDNKKRGDVPYWHCRNSWGTKWGDEGYFKMAMYPFNQSSQFDKEVSVRYGGQVVKIGGVVLVRATQPPVIKSLKAVQDKYKKAIILSKTSEFYNRDAGEFISSKAEEGCTIL